MAITVRNLYAKSKEIYNMKLLAGSQGLNRTVDWIQIVEDDRYGEFLRGNEIVVTVGYMNKGKKWLLGLVKKIYEKGASGLIITIGPYTNEIDKEVLEYCNENGFSLFSIPWETSVPDMTREYCKRILLFQKKEEVLENSLKNILAKKDNVTKEMEILNKYGFHQQTKWIFFVIGIESKWNYIHSKHLKSVKEQLEQIGKKFDLKMIATIFEKEVVVLMDLSGEKNERLFLTELNEIDQKEADFEIHIGVSEVFQGFHDPQKGFEHAHQSQKMAIAQKTKDMCYDQLDIYKLILGVKDEDILIQYKEDVLGPLMRYDKEQGTDLLGFLRIYLENNASPQVVAKQELIHRNTVNNQIKKIEKILKCDLANLESKFRCNMALLISRII